MENMAYKKKFLLMIALLIFVLILNNCTKNNSQQLGIPVPQDMEVVSLSSVIDNPGEFNGRTIVMKGTIIGQCASLCEFFFRDGTHRATIFPQGYQFPRLPQDRPVTVYVQVTSGEQIVFSALGVEIHY